MQRTDDAFASNVVSTIRPQAKVTQPTVSLLAGMRYTPAHATDIRQTFALARQAQEATQ